MLYFSNIIDALAGKGWPTITTIIALSVICAWICAVLVSAFLAWVLRTVFYSTVNKWTLFPACFMLVLACIFLFVGSEASKYVEKQHAA